MENYKDETKEENNIRQRINYSIKSDDSNCDMMNENDDATCRQISSEEECYNVTKDEQRIGFNMMSYDNNEINMETEVSYLVSNNVTIKKLKSNIKNDNTMIACQTNSCKSSVDITTAEEKNNKEMKSLESSLSEDDVIRSASSEEGSFSVKERRVIENSKSFTYFKGDTSEDVYKCYCCFQQYKDENNWQQHMSQYYNYMGCFPKKQNINIVEIADKVDSEKGKMFKCKSCGYMCKQTTHMVNHHEVHHGQRRLACGFCPNNVLVCLRYLKNHVTQCHAPRPMVFQCKDCEYYTAKKNNLERHVLSVHYQYKVTCELCLSELNKESLRNHMMTVHHENKDPLCCNLCSYTTYVSKYLRDHIKYKHSDETKVWKCDECSFETKYRTLLYKHGISKHSGLMNKSFCKQCDKAFKNYYQLYKHRQWVHSDKMKFTCTDCSYWSNRKDLYFIHLNQEHKNQSDYQCCQCKKLCKNPDEFQNHVYTVHDPFKIVYNCELCPFKSVNKRSVKGHMERKHENKVYKCQHCSYETICEYNLYKHIHRRHNGNRTVFYCFYCGFKSVDKSCLSRHIVKKHDNNV